MGSIKYAKHRGVQHLAELDLSFMICPFYFYRVNGHFCLHPAFGLYLGQLSTTSKANMIHFGDPHELPKNFFSRSWMLNFSCAFKLCIYWPYSSIPQTSAGSCSSLVWLCSGNAWQDWSWAQLKEITSCY